MKEETIQLSIIDDGEGTTIKVEGTPLDLVAMVGYAAMNDKNIYAIVMSVADAINNGAFDDLKDTANFKTAGDA